VAEVLVDVVVVVVVVVVRVIVVVASYLNVGVYIMTSLQSPDARIPVI